MWGRLRGLRSVRSCVWVLILLSLLGCATRRAVPMATETPATVPATERDATGAYRFNMTQHGRRMSADEFDAWMKARGIRVAKGAPAHAGKSVAAAPRLAKASKAKPPSTKLAAASTRPAQTSVRPATAGTTPTIVANNKKTATRKPKPAAPVKPVETASLQADQPQAKPARRGEG